MRVHHPLAQRFPADLAGVAALAQTLFSRQPASALWSTWIGRRLWWSYYMRILIYVTPRRALFWPTRDFTARPQELDLHEVRRVG